MDTIYVLAPSMKSPPFYVRIGMADIGQKGTGLGMDLIRS